MRSRNLLNVSIGVLLCLVVINGVVAWRNIQQLRENALRVIDTHAFLEALESTVATVTEAETGQRGYLITDDPSYLAPYEAAVAHSAEELDALEKLAADNPRLSNDVRRLRDLIDEKYSELAVTVALRKSGDFAGAQQVILTDDGKRTMDRIRALADGIAREERAALARRLVADRRGYRTAIAEVVFSAVAGIAALVALWALLHRHLRA